MQADGFIRIGFVEHFSLTRIFLVIKPGDLPLQILDLFFDPSLGPLRFPIVGRF